MSEQTTAPPSQPRGSAGRPVPHESARGHVTGTALYTDDLVGRFPQLLHAWPVVSPHAHARVLQIETARSFRIRRADRVLRVTLMGAVPYIATGLRIASATALILAITAELIIGSEGLGRSINIARQGGATDIMYALIVTTGLVGWGLNSLFAAIERRVLHWHPSQRVEVS